MYRLKFNHRAIVIRNSRYLFLIILVCITIFIHFPFSSLREKNSLPCSAYCHYSSHISNETLYFSRTHHIRHFPKFVCPQNFRNLADWVYGWPSQFLEKVEDTTNDGQAIAPCLPKGSIIYVRIWDIDIFFFKIYPHLINKFVLITGEGDLSSPTHLKYLHHPESKIIHWFGQNGQIDVSSSHKFTHIPIGINCYEMADAIETIQSEHPNHTIPSLFHEPDEPLLYMQPVDASERALNTKIPSKQLVLINFDPKTDKTGVRQQIWKDLCSDQKDSGVSFVDCITKPPGVQVGDLVSLYHRNRQYPFWLSPRGNGIDCHRTWEALYLDIIPIVWNSTLNVLYENLPVLLINHHSELNETLLYSKLKEISTKKVMEKDTYAYEKLRNSYWRRMILSKSRHARQQKNYERINRCWRAQSILG